MQFARRAPDLTRRDRGSLRNRLLAALPSADRDRLRSRLGRAVLPPGYVLQNFDRTLDQVFFLESGLASLQVRTEVDGPVEVGLIGRMDLVGGPVVLETGRAPIRATMQVGGEVLAIGAEDLRSAMTQSAPLRQLLLRAVQAASVQSAQLALCNARHSTDQRVARWLLTARDRLEADEIPVTHEVLSRSLGVRRSSVTDSISRLEQAGGVRGQRGCVAVSDPDRVHEHACGCYDVIHGEYERLLAPDLPKRPYT